MGEITRVGVDLAKRVIQVHAVDATGRVVVAKQLQRDGFTAWCAQLPPGCLVAMEACSGSHHWGRRLRAMGMEVKLIAPHFVSPYRLSGKTGHLQAQAPLLGPEPGHGAVRSRMAAEGRKRRLRLVVGVLHRFEPKPLCGGRFRKTCAIADRKDGGI